MKSNRKIIVSALTLFLAAISLAGCAKVARDPETTTAPETTTEEQTTEPTTELSPAHKSSAVWHSPHSPGVRKRPVTF